MLKKTRFPIVRGGTVLLAATAAVAVSVATAVAGGRQPVKLNRADQAAARSVVVRHGDLPGAGWKGGIVKADLSPPPTCSNYHPKVSDLILTGAAESTFDQPAVSVDSQVELLQTAPMVKLDWQREIQAPGVTSCLRKQLGRAVGPAGKVDSFARVAFPHVATYSAGFRGVVTVKTQAGQTARVLSDVATIGRGRTEITLTITGPYAAGKAMRALEVKLARTLSARIK